jgi:NAD(P)H dehydrogenase (quinone)
MYGHIATLADSILEGIQKVPEVQVDIYQIPETLPNEVLAKMHAAPKVHI